MAHLPPPRFGPLLLLLSLMCLNCTGAVTAQSADDQIGFVRLHMTHNTLSLIETTVKPGKLKRSRSQTSPSGAIEFEVAGKTGAVSFVDSIDDPLVQRLEGVGATGTLETKLVELDEAEFTVRIPYSLEQQTLSFYRLSTGDDPGKTRRNLIGTFELPQ
jgi:hypothetical protein